MIFIVFWTSCSVWEGWEGANVYVSSSGRVTIRASQSLVSWGCERKLNIIVTEKICSGCPLFQRRLLLLVLHYQDLIAAWQKSWHCLAVAILCSSTWKKWLLKHRNAQFWVALFSSLSSQYSLIFLTSFFPEIWREKKQKSFHKVWYLF